MNFPVSPTVKAVYKVVKWVVDNWSKLQKLAESVVAGVKALLDGSGVGRVAELVEEGVAKVFASAASFILSFFGLDAVPKAIRGVVSKLANVIPDKVRELLGKLKEALSRKLKALWGDLWGRVEWTVGGEKHKAWVDFKRGKVRVASTEEDASAKLQALKGRTDEAKNEKAQGLVAKAEAVLKSTQDSLASLQSSARQTEQKGQKGKKKGTEAKAVRDEAQKVESGVSALAMLLREIEEALGGGAGGTCKIGGRSQAKKAGCWREGTRSSRGNGWCYVMEEWRTGRLTRTRAEAEREEEAPPRLVILTLAWREVSLVQVDEANGGILTMKLLRPLSWLESEAVAVGAWVSVDLPELGVQGAALVTAVDPCPEIEQGEGRLVTGTFRRSQALVCELKVSDASEVLGVTPNHLVWSEDRCDWVAVADLRLGERLRAWDGSTPVVESLTACEEPEPVYNIEVEGDHCYRVGRQGLLVHNASVPPADMDFGCENKSGSGRFDPCNSGLLDTQLKGCQTDYQAHHLIACSVHNSSAALQRASQLGFDINGALNGWCLPGEVTEAKRTKLPLHRGRHLSSPPPDPNYFTCVQSLLAGLDAEYNSGVITNCNLCAKVASVITKIRKALATHKIWLQKADPNKGPTWQCPSYK